MSGKFCPKCGTERQSDEKFCRNCGYRFKNNDNSNHKTSRSEAHSIKKSPLNTKKLVLIGLGVIIVALICFFVWGNNYYSQNNQINRIAKSLSNTNDNASTVITTSDPNLKVNSKSVKSLQLYFENNKDILNTVVNKLEHDSSISGMKLVQQGNYWLFFPKYKLDVPAAYATIETNHANSYIYVDGKNVGKAKGGNGSYSKNVGPYFPGIHTFQVKTTVNGRNLQTNEDQAAIWGNDNEEEMTITTATFKVKSLANATVLLDGKDEGNLDSNGELKFKDYPITKGLELQVQANVNGKLITSKKMNVYKQIEEDDNATLSPKFAGLISKDDAQSLLSQAFDQSLATSDQGASLYQNQESNSDFKQVKKMFDGFNKDDNNLSYTTDVTIKSIMPDGNGKSDVSYDVKYLFDRDDGNQLAQVMHYNGCILEKNPDYENNNEAQQYMIDTIGTGKMVQNNTISNDNDNDD